MFKQGKFLMLAMLLLCAYPVASKDCYVAPDFDEPIQSIKGEWKSVSHFYGDIILLVFNNQSCDPSKECITKLEGIYTANYKRRFKIMSVWSGSGSTRQGVINFFVNNKKKVSYDVFADPDDIAHDAYEVKGTYPRSFLIDRDGCIAGSWYGCADANLLTIKNAVKAELDKD
ncbi:redoxin domain-containing protein [Elusimicrobiota bacterium]